MMLSMNSQLPTRRVFRWVAAALTLSAVVATDAAAAKRWKKSSSERGIVVHTREGAGGNLPEFRGTVTIAASVWELLAILDDLNSVCEWTKRCAANREVKRIGFAKRIFYNRQGATWPFADRDALMMGVVSGVEKGEDIHLKFAKIKDPAHPPVPGVVRMPQINGAYRLRRLGPKRTHVTFRVRAHPGGWVPDWAASWVAKRIPIDTLAGLRRQVKRTRGRYKKFLDKWDPARRTKKPPAGPQPSPPPATGAPRAGS